MTSLSLLLTVLALAGGARAAITIEPDPNADATTVYVPLNPEGVDMCRYFIEARLGARGEVMLDPKSTNFLLHGKVVGRMISKNDGSESALCEVASPSR